MLSSPFFFFFFFTVLMVTNKRRHSPRLYSLSPGWVFAMLCLLPQYNTYLPLRSLSLSLLTLLLLLQHFCSRVKSQAKSSMALIGSLVVNWSSSWIDRGIPAVPAGSSWLGLGVLFTFFLFLVSSSSSISFYILSLSLVAFFFCHNQNKMQPRFNAIRPCYIPPLFPWVPIFEAHLSLFRTSFLLGLLKYPK